MGPQRTNCRNTLRRYCNHWLTNRDVNYNLLRTLLTLSKTYRYLTTTNLCLLMWNHCSPVFHFNWLYSVLKPPSNSLLMHYHYRQKTLWTYLTSALHRLTFSTTGNTTSSCTEQLWGRRSPLLSQKLWCNERHDILLTGDMRRTLSVVGMNVSMEPWQTNDRAFRVNLLKSNVHRL